MHIFKDGDGREWRLSLNFHTLERLKASGVDLTDPQVVVRLGDDPYQLGTALWCLAERQAESAGITPEQFAEATADGDVIEAAVTALVAELVSFTRPARRAVLTKAMAAKRALEERQLTAATAMLDSGQIEKEADAAMAKLMDELTFAKSDTSSPELSASTPAP